MLVCNVKLHFQNILSPESFHHGTGNAIGKYCHAELLPYKPWLLTEMDMLMWTESAGEAREGKGFGSPNFSPSDLRISSQRKPDVREMEHRW